MSPADGQPAPSRTPTMAVENRTLAQDLRALPGEVGEVLRQMPSKGLLGLTLLGWLGLFHWLGNSVLGYVNTPSLFGWWWWVFSRPARVEHDGPVQWGRLFDGDESYMAFIPLVVVGLLWWKREEWLAAAKRVWWPALGLVVVGVGLHCLGFMVQQTRLSLLGFFVGLYGLTGLAWGGPWLRTAFFPFCCFAFCMPLGNLAEKITFPLRLWATELTAWVAHTGLGIGVVQNGTSLWDPSGRFQYEVAAACSGIRSLTAIFVLSMIYGYVMLGRNWQRLVLLAAAFPLAVVSNVTRLLAIIIAAEAFGQQAGNYVHESSLFSLLPYVPALAGLVGVGRLLRGPKSRPARAQEGGA